MNLEALRSTPAGQEPMSRVPAPRRRWLTRILLPCFILLLTGGLLAYAARDTFLPARTVTTASVVAKESSSTNQSNVQSTTVSVQAPGWVEPDPYPTYVTALTDGVIENVLVLEGKTIAAGQVVATMVRDDAQLAAKRAEAEVARQKAMLQAAQTDWDNPVALQRAVDVSEARIAETEAELVQLKATVAQQRARQAELQVKFDRIQTLSTDAASQLEIDTAKYQLDAQKEMVKATLQQGPIIKAKSLRYKAERHAAQDDLRLRVLLKKALDETKASVMEAEAALAEANLRVKRMDIVSPVAGVVMNRLVAPGTKIMLGMDTPHSAHVVHVYDPKHLQVRVDVPLADAAKVGVGQRAWVVVDVLPDQQFAGRVTRLVHLADISKNTVEVKVAIEDPSPLLKPDMLARVKFLATTKTGGESTSENASDLTVYIPDNALQKQGDEAFVWTIRPGSNTASRQTVKAGHSNGEGWTAVTSGLNPGDIVVTNPPADLAEDERVKTQAADKPTN